MNSAHTHTHSLAPPSDIYVCVYTSEQTGVYLLRNGVYTPRPQWKLSLSRPPKTLLVAPKSLPLNWGRRFPLKQGRCLPPPPLFLIRRRLFCWLNWRRRSHICDCKEAFLWALTPVQGMPALYTDTHMISHLADSASHERDPLTHGGSWPPGGPPSEGELSQCLPTGLHTLAQVTSWKASNETPCSLLEPSEKLLPPLAKNAGRDQPANARPKTKKRASSDGSGNCRVRIAKGGVTDGDASTKPIVGYTSVGKGTLIGSKLCCGLTVRCVWQPERARVECLLYSRKRSRWCDTCGDSVLKKYTGKDALIGSRHQGES